MATIRATLGLRPSKNVQNTLVPPIPLAQKWASMYKPTRSRPLLNLSQGVPGSPPPPLLRDSFKRATATDDCFQYGPVVGDPELRDALASEMKAIYAGTAGTEVDVKGEDVMITAGCNLAFVAAVMSLADKGDEVILPMPWYFNHHMTLTLLGVEPVPLETLSANGFQPSVEDCAKLITPRTKSIALVTPNNPTGAIYTPSLIQSFFDLAKQHNIALILDETYRDFIIPGPPHHLFSSGWRENLVHLFSFSKSYHIPGLRMGAIVVDPSHQESLVKILDTLQICAPTPPQTALASVLKQMRPHINTQASTLAEKHELFREHLPKSWKIAAQGGFYAFVSHPFPDIGAEELCRRLAVELGIVMLPGGFFGGRPGEEDKWIRVAVANVSKEQIVQCCERLKDCSTALGLKEANV